jgi:hypothetical protein
MTHISYFSDPELGSFAVEGDGAVIDETGYGHNALGSI